MNVRLTAAYKYMQRARSYLPNQRRGDTITVCFPVFSTRMVQGMTIKMLSGSPETLTKNISKGARTLLDEDASKNHGQDEGFETADCAGALMIFCGGLVMAIDDQMPSAVEALAHAVGHRDTMGLCCFGEQGMNNAREAMHGEMKARDMFC